MKKDNILPFDTETTGLPSWKTPSGGDDQPHIVQIAAHVVNANTREITQSLNVIIKPDGWVIPDETIEVHGITNEYAHDVGISEKLAFEMLLSMNEVCSLRIAHNTTFDNRLVRIGTKRYFSEQTQESWKESPYFCTMMNARKIMGGKNPKLEAAYKHFTGEELENAHTAMADTNACIAVYWGIKDHLAEEAA